MKGSKNLHCPECLSQTGKAWPSQWVTKGPGEKLVNSMEELNKIWVGRAKREVKEEEEVKIIIEYVAFENLDSELTDEEALANYKLAKITMWAPEDAAPYPAAPMWAPEDGGYDKNYYDNVSHDRNSWVTSRNRNCNYYQRMNYNNGNGKGRDHGSSSSDNQAPLLTLRETSEWQQQKVRLREPRVGPAPKLDGKRHN